MTTTAPPPRKEVFLQPGDYFVGDAGHRIRTVLGSCVSITLWHPARQIGAMSHFLLSQRGAGERGELAERAARTVRAQHAALANRDGRYGEEALALMLEALARHGVALADCEAKIFGGGDMFPGVTRAEHMHVGQKNGEAARAMLARRGVTVVSESLFGVGHRQIIFDVRTGHVWVAQVTPVEPKQSVS